MSVVVGVRADNSGSEGNGGWCRASVQLKPMSSCSGPHGEGSCYVQYTVHTQQAAQ